MPHADATIPTRKGAASSWRIAPVLGIFLIALFCLTTSKLQFGYEGRNIAQAEAMAGRTLRRDADTGALIPYTQGGLLEVIVYLPAAHLRDTLAAAGKLPGLQQLIYPFVVPILTTLMCLVFYLLALELYQDAATACALTLALALTTMIWPYAKFGMETQQTLWTLVALATLVRFARAPTFAAAAGFGMALGVLMLTKITGPVQASVLALAALWASALGYYSRPAPRLRHVAGAALPCLLGVALLLYSNKLRYGGWLWQGRYGADAETIPYPLIDALWALAASPGKSIFIFSPPLFAALWFWGPFWRRFAMLRPAIIGLAILAAVHLSFRPWADETWGPRRLHYLVPLMLLPLGIAFERRRELSAAARGLIRLALLGGFVVQVLAVMFDYTSLALVVGRSEVFAQENTVWQPSLSPLVFNVHLLESAVSRLRGGRSLPFVYERHYLPWTAPDPLPPTWNFPLNGRDRFDLWPLQQAADWGDRPYWFHSPSSWLAEALLMIVAGCGVILMQGIKRREMDAGDDREFSSPALPAESDVHEAPASSLDERVVSETD